MFNSRVSIKRLFYFVCIYHVAWLVFIKNPTVRELRGRSRTDNLVVYNALGHHHNLALVEHSRRNIFKPKKWDCVAFLSGVGGDKIPDDEEFLVTLRDELGCSISRPNGVVAWDWGTFLQFITPTFVSNYDYVALVLDDVFIPDRGNRAIDPKKMIQDMEKYGIDVMSPSILGDSHGLRQVAIDEGVDGCLMEVDMIDSFVQLFTRDAWECFFNMLAFTDGKGWCYDTCFQSQCPDFKMAQNFQMRAMHMDKWVVELNYNLPVEEVAETNLTDWKAKPRDSENEHFEKPELKVCGDLGCERKVSKAMRKISCPSSGRKKEKLPSFTTSDELRLNIDSVPGGKRPKSAISSPPPEDPEDPEDKFPVVRDESTPLLSTTQEVVKKYQEESTSATKQRTGINNPRMPGYDAATAATNKVSGITSFQKPAVGAASTAATDQVTENSIEKPVVDKTTSGTNQVTPPSSSLQKPILDATTAATNQATPPSISLQKPAVDARPLPYVV